MKTHRRYSTQFRANELDRLFVGRYGSILPDDDAGRDDAAVMLDHLAGLDDFHSRADGFLNVRAPWMSDQERTCLKQRAISSRRHWTASELGEHLRLQPAERSTYRTWSIRPVDANGRAWTVHQLREARVSKARERARRARARAKGKRLLQRRPKVVDRAWAVLTVLSHHARRTIAWIIVQVEHLPEFQNKRGKRPAASSMPRLVKRAVDYLKSKDLVAVRKQRGVRGDIIEVTRCVRLMRSQDRLNVDSGRTNMSSQRQQAGGHGQFAAVGDEDKKPSSQAF